MIGILAHLFDPLTLAAMLGGVAVVALAQNGVQAVGRACVALRPLLRADPLRDRDAARTALLQIDQVAQLRGLMCIDRVKSDSGFMVKNSEGIEKPPDSTCSAYNQCSHRSPSSSRKAILF